MKRILRSCCHAARGGVNAALLLAFLLATSGCTAETKNMPTGGAAPRPSAPPAPTAEIAARLDRLTKLADSTRSEDQTELARLLSDKATLDGLDDPKASDKAAAAELHVSRVISRLGSNSAPNAARTLAAVAQSEAYNASWQRQELLVRALVNQRPLLPESIKFLEAQTQPDSVNLHIAIDTLAANGSAPALELLGRKLADSNLEPEYKIAWMRDVILRHRRDPPLLKAAEQWLSEAALDQELRTALAEALFEYKPQEWYPGREGVPRPPPESATRPEAAKTLRAIGAKITAGNYPESLKAAVKRVLNNLPSAA